MRFSLGVTGMVVLALAAPSAALASPPTPTTQAADQITNTSAVLHGKLTSLQYGDDYNFQFGLTTAYGAATSVVTHHSLLVTTVYASATITGLTPGTTYHFRLVGRDGNNVNNGVDLTVTTTGTAPTTGGGSTSDGSTTGSGTGAPTGATLSAPGPADLPSLNLDGTVGPPPEPELGQSVVVGVDQGTVKVRVPGATGFTTLSGADAIPVGALVDTREGAVVLQAATPQGVQDVELRGALFEVRQTPNARGMTDLVLRGGDFADCKRSGVATARAAAVRGRRAKPKRTLWASDDGGRFRTRGRNSVATVRGTSWVTTDTCEGTRTRVTEGAVVVRDLARHKNVTVRAGQSYLARSKR